MEVVVLNENAAGMRGLLSEHGLSLLIKTETVRLLFDTGQSDVFLRNAEHLGESLLELDGIVLSHGHFDHCGGLEYLVRTYEKARKPLPPVYVREPAFRNKMALNNDRRTYRILGIPWKREILDGAVRLTKDMEAIAEKVWVLGNIRYKEGLEKRPKQFFVDDGEKKIPDYMEDEQMLVFETDKGLCVFAGCCHPGILNCLEYVKESFPGQHIYSMFAGMHLMGATKERIDTTINLLAESGFSRLFPVHCTGLEAIGRMKVSLGERCEIIETGRRLVL